jgi:outer membrane immunogenic protein
VALRFGIENNLSFGTVNGSTTTNCVTPCQTRNTVLDTVLGKVGLTFGRTMPYLAGGLAYGNIRADVGAFPGNTTWKTGWAVGAGIETKLNRVASVKLEYLHVDLGSGTCTPLTCGGNASIRLTEDIVRIGVNFALGGPSTSQRSSPLVTK